MVAEKWEIVEEDQMPNGRVMLKVNVGTLDKETVYEYIYRFFFDDVLNGTFKYNQFTKTIPAVCVYFNDTIIPHNGSIDNTKKEVKERLLNAPAKLLFKSANNKKVTGAEYALLELLDNKYNVEFIRLCAKELLQDFTEGR